MKKRSMIFTTAAMVLLFTGCQTSSDSGGETKNPSIAISYPLTLQVGYSTGEDDPRGEGIKIFQELVEEKTNGDILIEAHPSGEITV